MAEMNDMLKRMERASSKHSKTQEKIEALKRQLAEEEKQLQRERDRVNGKWMRKFSQLAEKQGINVFELDPGKIMEMVAESPEDFMMEISEPDVPGKARDLQAKTSLELGKDDLL